MSTSVAEYLESKYGQYGISFTKRPVRNEPYWDEYLEAEFREIQQLLDEHEKEMPDRAKWLQEWLDTWVD